MTDDGEWVNQDGVRVRFSPDEHGRWLIREIAAEDGGYLSITRLVKLRLPDLEVFTNWRHRPGA